MNARNGQVNKPDEKRKKKHEYDKARYLVKRDEILAKNRKRNKEYYLKNRDKIVNHHKAYNKEYYKLNRDDILEKTKNRQKKNRAVILIRERAWIEKNKDHVRTRKRNWRINSNANLKGRQRSRSLRNMIISHYTDGMNACMKCGVVDVDLLCLDHINNDGADHRKKVGSSKGVYAWVVKNQFPLGFQILCWNCNFLKSRHAIRTKNQRSDLKMKELTLRHYSPNLKCSVCDEARLMVLSIDHINGGGNKERGSVIGGSGGSAGFYRWLRKNDYPIGYRVLCLNCNCKLGLQYKTK